MHNAALKNEHPGDLSPTSLHFIDGLRRAAHVTEPFDHWLFDDILPESTIDAMATLPFAPPPEPVFDGRRESNNSTRVYFSGENQTQFPVCRDVADTFSDRRVIAEIERMTKADLSDGHLRIEYCQDVDGFWLEPHQDIKVKLFTMLIYLSDDPKLRDAGTDVYDDTPEHNRIASVPYEKNKGLIFVPGATTWHGFSKRRINGLRKQIIINYVSSEWRNKAELSYY